MRYIRKKTSVRSHKRQTKHKVADVRNHDRNIRARQRLGIIALNNMTYKQAKKTFPGLNPYGDIDKDRVKNRKDCRPFDTGRQDDAQDLLNELERDEAQRREDEQEKLEAEEQVRREEEEYQEKMREEDRRLLEEQRIREWGLEQNRRTREHS